MDVQGVVGVGSQGPWWMVPCSSQRTSRSPRILRQDTGNSGRGQGLSLLETSEALRWTCAVGLAQSNNIRTMFRHLFCVSHIMGRLASASQAHFLFLLGTQRGSLLWLHS